MRLVNADDIPYTMLYKEDFMKHTGCEAQAAWKKDIDALPTVDAIPIKWLTAQADNPSNSDKLRNAIDYVVYYLVYTRWQGRKEE